MKLNKTFKKSISIILTIIMVFSMMSVAIVSTNAAISAWYVAGSFTNWESGKVKLTNNSVTLDLSNYVGTQISFKMIADEGGNHWCGASSGAITAGSAKALVWDGGNDMTFTPSKAMVTFKLTVSGQTNYVTVTQADKPTVDPTDPPVTTTNWYATGRFGVKNDNGTWTYAGGSATGYNATSKNIQFTKVSDTLYSLDTNATIKELSTHTSDNDRWYFKFYNGSTVYYTVNSADVALTKSNAGTDYSTGTSTDKGFYFNDTTDESGNVILYLNTAGSTPVFYFEVEGDTPPTEKTWYLGGEVAIKDSNGNLKWASGVENTNSAHALTSQLPFTKVTDTSYKLETGLTLTEYTKYQTETYNSTWYMHIVDGTAEYSYNGNTINWSENEVNKPYTLIKDYIGGFVFNGTSDKYVTIWLDTTNESAPKVYFTLDEKVVTDKKLTHITGTDEIYIDAAPSVDDASTLIRWHSDKTFYMPKNVDLTKAHVYNGYSTNITFNGKTIKAGSFEVMSLADGGSYSVSVGSKTAKIMQGSTNAMFILQKDELPTSTKAGDTKDDVKIKGGTCITMTNEGTTTPVFSDALDIDNVKGRGNSSWEASRDIFGKYAFNMKLENTTHLFGMDAAESKSGAKSWCLLANNADESMMRNAVAYQLAAEIGIEYPPEFRFVDIYSNGKYLGAYLVTEKVDVGKKKLIKGEAFDDLNEKAVQKALGDPEAKVDETTHDGTYTYNNESYYMKYCTVSTNTEALSKIPVSTDGTYLLEFEIKERVDGTKGTEPSYFKSPKGQNVVIKSPEFATKEQVEYIAQKFAEMEEKAYADSSETFLTNLSAYMNIESFAKMYLIQELSSNLDAASTSYFITYDCSKGENARFTASPVWDYDWAFGQYYKKVKYEASDAGGDPLDPAAPKAWFAKDKARDDSTAPSRGYSIQSKLANNEKFQTVIRKCWYDNFYSSTQDMYKTNGYIDQWKSLINKSIAMNEDRWGFIKNDPIYDWGSLDTGDTFDETVNYLKNKWLKVRVEEFLNIEIPKYGPYSQVATPTLKVYATDGETELTGSVDAGASFVLKAITTETYVTYELYEGSTKIATNTTGKFTISDATVGTHSYTVKTIYGSSTKTSSAISVNVLAVEKVNVPDVAGMTQAEATTALTEAGLTISVFYEYSETVPENTVISSNPTAGAEVEKGATVKVIVSNGPEPSTEPTLPPGKVLENVKVYFKGTNLKSLTPSLTINGTPYTLTKDAYIGTYYNGSYRFYWWTATIPKVTVGDSYNVTIKTSGSSMNAVGTINFSTCNENNEIYLAVDNMQTGSTFEDITNNDTAKMSFRSSANMITNVENRFDPNKSLAKVMMTLFNMDGTTSTKKMSVGDTNADGNVNIKDATLAQMMTAGIVSGSDTNNLLGDYDISGDVNIKDATGIQSYIVNY